MICSHLNINSVTNTFKLLSNIIKNHIDILMISVRKFDSPFPNGHFQIYGYSELYRFDRNGNGDGILLFIREDIPTKPIESQMKIKGFSIELNLRRRNLCCSYNSYKYSQKLHHLKKLGKDLDLLTSKYFNENLRYQWDFNAEPADTVVSNYLPSTKSSYQVRKILQLFCHLIVLILG